MNNLRCVIAGIKDFYGQIITINPKISACYQCVFTKPDETPPEEGPFTSDRRYPWNIGYIRSIGSNKNSIRSPKFRKSGSDG